MQQKRPPSTLWIAITLLFASQSADALGWARADQAAVLGRPLSFSATLRLDPGDEIAPECVRAEVASGDRVLPSALVHVHADASAEALTMRVLTEPTIDEPVVTVTLAVGCPTKLSRRFVLFADPAPVPPAPMAAAVPASRPVDLPPAAAPAASVPQTAALPPPRPAAPSRAEDRPRAPAPGVARPRAVPRSSAPAPRLRLDPVEPLPSRATATAAAASAVQDAIAAVSRAASAAEAAASAASAAEARVATLEQSVRQLRADADQSRQLVTQLRRELAEAREDRWHLPLILAVAALLALAGGLWWRLRALQQERQRAWRRAATADAPPQPPTPTSQLPLMTSEIPMPPVVPPPRPPIVPPTPGPEVHEIHSERTQILPTGSRADEGAPRDVTIEELLDLEQQAEFFIVLGQDDAAIDLLVEHLRDTGGGSPLPYLKLLEIYRRRGEREAYERTRERFNRRFNAYAPEWEADLQHGRSLDDYPGVLPRLQQVWGRPLDAMAELEALLFRKSRGELFDLPAYREVLFLYSLARDLLDREAVESGTVDLLLPLAEESDFGMTSPHPYLTLERESVFDPGTAAPAPVAAIDLDLSEPEPDPGPPTAPDGGLNLIPPRG